MRISQFARKYDLSVQEVSNYLNTLDEPPKSVHPNAKLGEELIKLVMDHFKIDLEESESIEIASTSDESPAASPIEENTGLDSLATKNSSIDSKSVEHIVEVPETPQEDIAITEGEIIIQPQAEVPLEPEDNIEIKVSKESPETAEEVILSDQLIEMLESEETPADLEKIKLIKAPKKKLSGLKVVDKIDLPEDRLKKTNEQVEEKSTSPKYTPEERAERARVREEQKEKRRLEAKRKKEAYEARKEQRQKEQEKKRLKSRKEAHYKQKLDQPKPQKAKQKLKKQSHPKQSISEEQQPEPKTLIGKFWRWLNN